jgi:ubiquinone biosynthesis monooxygenase Coq7
LVSLEGVRMNQLRSTTHHPAPSGFARRFSAFDRVLAEFGRAVQVLDGSIPASRPNPAASLPDDTVDTRLTAQQKKHAAGLMRVNHVGEICAQALYRGQAVFCRDAAIQSVFYKAASEEVDHLVWCNQRLRELSSRPSVLNPVWYLGSFTLGALAGRAGTARNLGFMAETEWQVEQHLDTHLQLLPQADQRSRRIVEQMRADEIDHRHTAQSRGAARLPAAVKGAMRFMSKIMTTTAYRI